MRQGGVQQQVQQKPPTPPVDPTNEEFVVFFRAENKPQWLPFSIVQGGSQANILVKAMGGKVLDGPRGRILTNNIAQVCNSCRVHSSHCS
jgi:hypothetical protein